LSFKSRPLLTLAREQYEQRKRPARKSLAELLCIDSASASPLVTEVTPAKVDQPLLICVNGNEADDWQAEKDFLHSVTTAGWSVSVVDPRGVGKSRPALQVKGHAYADALCGVEENLAYNAFLVGQSLVGLRVA